VRWRHQSSDPLYQFQWREGQLVHLGATLFADRFAVLFGAAVRQGSALFAKALHGKGWAGAIPPQPLQRSTVVRRNADTGVTREATVLVGQHLLACASLAEAV
jgi:hypothetical protein